VATRLAATALAELGHQVRVLTVGNRLDSGATADDRVVVVGVAAAGRPGAWWRTRRRLYRRVAKWAAAGEVDAVEVPDYRGWSAFWGQLPVPVIGRLHGSHTVLAAAGATARRWRQEWIETKALQRWDYCSAVSDAVAGATAKAFPGAVTAGAIIPDPVPLPPADPDSEDRPAGRVIHVGTLNDNKGVRRVLAVWPAVRRQFPDSSLELYVRGSAADRQRLADEVATLGGSGVEAGVHMYDWQQPDDLVLALRQAAVAVFPSRFEAFGLAAAEAMGCGCAVIAASTGAGPELIRHGQDGILVDPLDETAIREALQALLARPAHAESLGREAARRIRRRCAPARVATVLVDWYSDCCRRFLSRSSETMEGRR
jgi:glycosyltransferase involved in cell wall biosynthesis